jgi:hypothetical protein
MLMHYNKFNLLLSVMLMDRRGRRSPLKCDLFLLVAIAAVDYSRLTIIDILINIIQ